MKNIFLLIIFLLLSSCSQKQHSKSGFKITLGRLAGPMDGGAFVNFIDKKTTAPNIVKLDAENSATIPFGLYDILVVVFEGPETKCGNMYCGSVLDASLATANSTFTLNVTATECLLPLYQNTIIELKSGTAAKWGVDLFDLSHWGP